MGRVSSSFSRRINIVLLGLASTSTLLVFRTYSAVTYPKVLVASAILGFTFFLYPKIITTLFTDKQLRLISIITMAIIVCSLASLVKAGDFYTGFVGVYGRYNGLIPQFSYLFIFLIAALTFQQMQPTKIINTFLGLTTCLILYGILQHLGLDVFEWEGDVNPIVGTLGNPNYYSSFVGIGVVMFSGKILFKPKSRNLPLFASIAFLGTLTIYWSGSIQGLLVIAFGLFIEIIALAYRRRRSFAVLFAAGGLLATAVALMGMLNKGPLSGFLYKDSVQYRGDYWRAGVRMARANPLFGLGPEQYGNYFPYFRDVKQVARRGPDLISTDAHSYWIQKAVTLGLVTTSLYLLLIVLITYLGFKTLHRTTAQDFAPLTVIFAAWMGFLAQSFISIEEAGLTTWGWVFGAALVAAHIRDRRLVASQNPSPTKGRTVKITAISSKENKAFYLALFGFLAGLLAFSPMANADVSLVQTLVRAPVLSTASGAGEYRQRLISEIEKRSSEPQHWKEIINVLMQTGYKSDSFALSEAMVKKFSRDVGAWELRRQVAERFSDTATAITAREEIALLDPYNLKNLLALQSLYSSVNREPAIADLKGKISTLQEEIASYGTS